MLYERMEQNIAAADEPETEARRRAMEEEEALLKASCWSFMCIEAVCMQQTCPCNVDPGAGAYCCIQP